MSDTSILWKLASVKARAIGIRPGDIFSPIPDKRKPFTTDLSIQRHETARKRPPHFDLRLDINGIAYSWAIPKAELPSPGEKKLAIRTFDHDVDYMPYEGKIGKGYGEGDVKLHTFDKVDIVECNPERIKFNLYGPSTEVNRYNLVHSKDNTWLLLNQTKTRDTHPDIPDYKPKYKEKSIEQLDSNNPEELWSAKIDGAHATIHINPGKQVEVYSYRKSKLNPSGLINHTYKIPKLIGKTAPLDITPMILRGEVFGTDIGTGHAVPSKDIGGILNSATLKSREKQLGATDMRIALHDVHSVGGTNFEKRPYDEKLAVIEEISKAIPELEVPRYAITPQEKTRLIDDIKSGKVKETKEGIVAWNLLTGGATKAKVKPDFDVIIENVFPEKGSRDMAGGFEYSHLDKPGKIVGKVGTGFNFEEKIDMLKNFEKNWKGRVARVWAQEKHPSGALRAPAFTSLHPDYPEKIK